MKSHHTIKEHVSLLLVASLVAPLHAAEKELKSVAVTVGGFGNTFFVRIARGAESFRMISAPLSPAILATVNLA
jgi:ABC-type sugar transport system substrate-binding protein